MPKPHEKHEQAVIKRASRKQADDSSNGAWKVAFADFCLALLSLFLVLWLMAAREQQAMKEIMLESKGSKMNDGQGVMPEQKGGPRGSLIERFPMPRTGSGDAAEPGRQAHGGALDAGAGGSVSYQSPEDLRALSRALAKLSAEAGLSNNLESVVTPYGLRVMLHDTDRQGMFVRGSAVPTERFRLLLRQMGPLFARMDNQMLIVGHTDTAQYAASDFGAFSNWTLSSNRALAARANLLAGGMPAGGVLQVVGMADRAPLASANGAAAVNRRIELLILTRAQAGSVTAMFGVAAERPLGNGIDTSLPRGEELRSLREQIAPPAGTAN